MEEGFLSLRKSAALLAEFRAPSNYTLTYEEVVEAAIVQQDNVTFSANVSPQKSGADD